MKYIFIVNNVYKGFRSDCLSHDRHKDIRDFKIQRRDGDKNVA